MTDEQFLRALYGGLLGREPDPQGLQHHLQALHAQQADPARYQRLMALFADSAEARLLAERRAAPAGANAFLPDLSGVAFGHAVSLGSFCHAAMALKRAELRRWSGPFDWIFSNLAMAAHCLQDDFATFLDPAHWASVPVGERVTPEANRCEHRFYRERFGVRFVFNHHDPAASEQDADYLRRCVARMRLALRSPAWKLFTVVQPGAVTLERLQPLLAALQATTSNYVVLALQFNAPAPSAAPAVAAAPALLQALRTRRLRHDLLVAELNVAAPSNGVEFPQPQDNRLLDRFLRTFRVQPQALPLT